MEQFTLEQFRNAAQDCNIQLTVDSDDKPFLILDSSTSMESFVNIFYPTSKISHDDYRDDYGRLVPWMFKVTPRFESIVYHALNNIPLSLTESDVKAMREYMQVKTLLNAGQLFLSGLEYTPESLLPDELITEILAVYDDNDYLSEWSGNRLDHLNDYLEVIPENAFDYGYSDEYSTCSNCYCLINTTFHHPEYKIMDGEILCESCLNERSQ